MMTGAVGRTSGLDTEHRGFHCSPPEGDLQARAHEAAHELLGPYGIVRQCRPFPEVPGLPTVPVFVARGPKRLPSGRKPGFDIIGMGVSDHPDDAWLKAVVEAVERYCFAWPHDPALIQRRSYKDVEEWAIPLELFRPFTEEQYRRTTRSLRFPGPSDPIDWAWAYSLTRDCFALVPAVLAYATVGFRPPNNFVACGSSTGLACHISVEAALLAGLLEVVERDAIMLYWLNRRSPRRVMVDDAAGDGVARLLRDHFRLPDFEFVLLDITGDSGIPTIGCRSVSANPGRPASAFGAASRPEPVSCARKALFEAAQVLCGLHGLGCDGGTSIPETAVLDIVDHARFYAGTASADRIEFLTTSEEHVLLGDLPGCGGDSVSEELRECVDRLAKIGLEVLAVDLTPADVGRCGLRTVKVIVPGMIDINADAALPQLGPARVRQVPPALGWPALGDNKLNLAPCPMS